MIFGAAFCAVIAMLGSQPGWSLLIPFASIGLIYIGFEGKNLIWGTFLGAIGSIPLFLVGIEGGLGAVTPHGYSIEAVVGLMLVSCLILGAILGFMGTLLRKSRDKTLKRKEEKEKIGKNKSKKK